MIKSFTQTHIGKRKINEDSYLVDQQLGLYVVADGVGGLEKGEVASNLACKTILTAIQSGASLQSAIHLAHQAIIDEVKTDNKKKGMATTIVALLIKEGNYEIVWVGDSRVYLWDDELHLITKDDSYIEILLESGHISLEDLDTHPDRNVISQALGIERKDLELHSNQGCLQKNQLLLICTDGLFGVVKELGMINQLKEFKKIEILTNSLVQLAVDKGGSDNITLMILASSSEDNNLEDIVTTTIYRNFDSQTGGAIGASLLEGHATREPDLKETDPELIDQTTFKDMSEEERNLLDEVATKRIEIMNKNTPKISKFYWFMFAIIIILAIVFVIISV